MALRCASVGACENTGMVRPNRMVANGADSVSPKSLFQNKMNWGPVMKPTRSLTSIRLNGSARQKAGAARRVAVAILAFVTLAACEQNSFVPPPPPKVDVGVPIQRSITRYLEATGNTAPIKSVDLVARVQGFLQAITYQ